ncbi:MAG: Pyrolysin, partial [Bacteroidota bacterium]
MYLTHHSNRFAGQMTRTDQLYQGGSLGVSLNGGSDTLSGWLGIWDGGTPLLTHQEFTGRISSQETSLSSDLHSTHVAGTLISSGINNTARGMAFGANLKAWD